MRCLIVDPLEDFHSVALPFSSPDRLADYLGSLEDPNAWRVAYSSDRLDRNLGNEFDRLCVAAYDMGDLLFVIDEVDRFCTASYISPAFERLIKYGLHAKRAGAEHPVHFLAISRAPAEIHKALIVNAFEFCCFAIAEANALEYIRASLGKEYTVGLDKLPMHVFRRQDMQDRSHPFEDLTLLNARKGDVSHASLVRAGKKEESPAA